MEDTAWVCWSDSNRKIGRGSVGVELSVVALSVDRLAVHVAHEAALAARELRHVIGPAKLVDDLVQRVVGHLQLVELAEELLLEALELLDLRGTMRIGGQEVEA
eukprot:scaffold6880_cov110-Isochrysis_galbana.AAC.11